MCQTMLLRSAVILAAAMTTVVAAGVPAEAQGGRFGAQSKPRLIRVGFAGGMTVPVNDAKKAFENGITGQGFVLLNLGFLPTLRFNLSYQKFDLKEALLQGADGNSQLLGGTAGLTIPLLRGPVRPYVSAGLGAFNVRNSLQAAAADSTRSSTELGIDGGAGIAIHLGRLDAFIEGRIQNVYTNTGFIDTKSIKTVPVMFGIVY